jgi:hypothetical protein
MKTIVRTERKRQAQEEIMNALMAVFYRLGDRNAPEDLIAETHAQVNRIEKLFGYDPNSWRV